VATKTTRQFFTFGVVLNIRFACLITAIFLAGCGGESAKPPVTTTPPVLPPPAVEYHAYGDSITYGFLLPDRDKQAYPALVAGDEKVTAFADYAIPGQEACDIAKWQIAPNYDSPTLATHPHYSVLIGTNDIFNPQGHEIVYTLCYQAVLSWLAVPREFKVLAGDQGMTTSGSGEFNGVDNWKAWTTQAEGASVSFAITTTREGPIYAWPKIDDNSTATFSYSLDGVLLGQASTSTSPPLLTKVGTTRALGFLRFPDVPAGPHTVTFTQTSTGTVGVAIVGIGAPDGQSRGELPTVLAGTIPYQYYSGKAGPCVGNDPLCLAYIQKIMDSVNMFHSDGLEVKLFDTRKYMFGTKQEMADSLHPNALGHQELSQSVEAAW
jgi:hypothetical protein